MIVVTGGRQSGKTEAICRWMFERPGGRAVIVANMVRKQYILGRLSVGGLRAYPWKNYVISATEIQVGGYSRGMNPAFHVPEVCIDDLEDVFQVLFGVSLEFVTMTATWLPLGPVEPIKVDAQAGEATKEILAYDDPEFVQAGK